MNVAVLGGGVTGLTVAYRLAKKGVSVRLFERSERAGGIVATERRGPRIFELGPDCFLTGTKPWAHDLALELGLEAELIRTTETHRRSFVLSRGRLVPIPEGFHLIAPTSFASFLRSPLLSRAGKLRALAELALSPAPRDDEALRSFVVRRFGRELFERLAEPLVAGIFTADPTKLSLRATFPQFLDMERSHGSVTRAVWSKKVEASGARYGLFATFKGGAQALTDALRAKLPAGALALGVGATAVSKAGDGFLVEHGAGRDRFDRVLVALPAPAAASVLAPLDAELAALLRAIPYASAATVSFVFRRAQVRHPLDGMGFVCPSRERRFILACTFTSTKFAGRVEDGRVLLRAFVGGVEHREKIALGGAEIARRALAELRELLGIEGEPEETVAHLWHDAMPQYVLGHLDRAAAIEKQVAKTKGLAYAGNALRGVGIPDCVRSANLAVECLVP